MIWYAQKVKIGDFQAQKSPTLSSFYFFFEPESYLFLFV
jgi:hypothetical protein